MKLLNRVLTYQFGSRYGTRDLVLWPYLWAASLALVWLLPVGSAPWTTYAADLWMAIVGLSVGVTILLMNRAAIPWHATAIGAAFSALVPWFQWATGLLPYFGQAWIASLYMSGFCLAILIGTAWERLHSSQFADFFGGAVLFAAVASVGLQLYAWSGLSDSGALGSLFSGMSRDRPSGALGQPNQLATFLLWGLIATFHFYSKKIINEWSSIAVAAFLLLGIALTQSRTGILSVTCVWAWIFFRRKIWSNNALTLVTTGLFIYFLVCPYVLKTTSDLLLLDQGSTLVRLDQKGEVRLQAWYLLIQSAFAQPWWGYGWAETSVAQILLSDKFDTLGGVFSHSHNLFLDLILWMGFPVAGVAVSGFLYYFTNIIRRIQTSEEGALVLYLFVLGVHAMLEFPLQYAYFLLPAGLILGVLSIRVNLKPMWKGNCWIAPSILVALSLAVGITVKDYSSVERSYLLLRLEQGVLGQNRPPLGGAPDVRVLSHLREWIVVSRIRPQPNMAVGTLAQMEVMTQRYPSRSFAFRLATAYALNDRPQEALMWLNRICKFTDAQDCALTKNSWKMTAKQDERLAAIPWPPL